MTKLSPLPAPTPASAQEATRALMARVHRYRFPDVASVMGVVNVTPDSFSDGGRFLAPDNALAHARRLVADGADILDIGAESTRPYGGAEPVSAAEECRRLAPVLPTLVTLGVPVSIDTMKAEVAAFAFDHGVTIANDVWGLQRDPEMARLIAARGVPAVVMHNRDTVDPGCDIMADMMAFFQRTLAIADAAGVARTQLILDPGIGFGKDPAQSLIALARVGDLAAFGLPILVGASRKRFIAAVSPAEADARLGGSVVAHCDAARRGAAIVRVHDVRETAQALRVQAAIARHGAPAPQPAGETRGRDESP